MANGLLRRYEMNEIRVGSAGEMVRTRKTEVIGAKHRPLPFRQPQIPKDWP